MMNRPKLSAYIKPKHIKDYPCGPCVDAGRLVTENSGWRTEKPVVDETLCVNCLVCYLSCPDGVIYKAGSKVDIDYSFCKGCGICARVCKKGAITLVREGQANGG